MLSFSSTDSCAKRHQLQPLCQGIFGADLNLISHLSPLISRLLSRPRFLSLSLSPPPSIYDSHGRISVSVAGEPAADEWAGKQVLRRLPGKGGL